MAPTVADYLLERLRGWDVQHVFAYAGDGINGILAAWGRADNKPQFVQARHEEMAAFEAVGYAKFTGRFTAGIGHAPDIKCRGSAHQNSYRDNVRRVRTPLHFQHIAHWGACGKTRVVP